MDELTPYPEYEAFFTDLRERIRAAQVRAALAVNRELVILYWQVGHETLVRQEELGWGAKVIDRISQDLRASFPEMQGFSPRNLKYMRAFAEAWPDESIVQQFVAQIPWGYNVRILDKVATPKQREWYIAQTIENGWSRNVLVYQIESRLFERQGKAVTNFERTLPPAQSDLARELLKDPYNFDFLTLGATPRSAIWSAAYWNTSVNFCWKWEPGSRSSAVSTISTSTVRIITSICCSTM